jgi:hypothetical protein
MNIAREELQDLSLSACAAEVETCFERRFMQSRHDAHYFHSTRYGRGRNNTTLEDF